MRKYGCTWGGKRKWLLFWAFSVLFVFGIRPIVFAAESVLTLDMALSQAVAEHSSVKSAERGLDSAQLAVESEQTDNKFHLSASVTPLQYSSRGDGFELGESLTITSSLRGLNGLEANATLQRSSDEWVDEKDEGATLSLSWDLWPSAAYSADFLALKDVEEKADLARVELDNARALAVIEVYKAYRNLQFQEARVALAQQTYEVQAELYQQVVDKFKKGLASKADVLLQKTQMEQSRSDYEKAAAQMSLDFASFVREIGLAEREWNLEPLPTNIEMIECQLSVEEGIRLAETNSAEVLEKQQQLAAAQRALEAARVDAGLEISLSGNVALNEKLEDPSYGVFLTVSYDLFDGGAREIQMKQLELALVQAQEELENVKFELGQTVQSNLYELERLANQVEIAQLNLERAQLEYEAKQGQQRQGLISSLEAKEQEIQLEEYRVQWLEALVNYEAMRLNLMQLTGQALDVEGGILR